MSWCIEVASRRGRRKWRRETGYYKIARAVKVARNWQRKNQDNVYRLRHRSSGDFIMACILV